MRKNSVKEMCLNAVLIAMVCVLTMVVQIPTPATSGYVHLGDGMILIVAIFLGWKYGAIAGGIGSMLADILSGYSYWAPFTLIIKALMGFAAGKLSKEGEATSIRNLLASFAAVVIMISGYLVGGTILKGSFVASLASVPANIIQGFSGIIVYVVLGTVVKKSHLTDRLT